MARRRTATDRQTGELFRIVKFSGCSSEYRRAYVKGWQHGIDGLGYSLDYDAMSHYAQKAYEDGRLDACNVRTAGITVPWWATVSTRPPFIERAISQAVQRIGSSRPASRENVK